MKNRTKTILEELTTSVPTRDQSQVIESRGAHVIASAINLLENIREIYGEDVGSDMEKRLISSIRARRAEKFSYGAKKLK